MGVVISNVYKKKNRPNKIVHVTLGTEKGTNVIYNSIVKMGSSVFKPVRVRKKINNGETNLNITEKKNVILKSCEKTPKYTLTNTIITQEKSETSKTPRNLDLGHTPALNITLSDRKQMHVKLTNHTNKTYFSNIQHNHSSEVTKN
ncbi:hypothetical protein KUTeg_022109 [Tegillarca granosa]|uniref:Uncharacterized protein n=1 Tax=Tegillarca granosa TaxID=220873 RepID=A0ABQ9E633_TEGGR|nr:hypothetical protein KUTeg_022109 [Tegillarca granosa]